MKLATVLLCLAACTFACGIEEARHPSWSASDFPADTDWLARAREALTQADWPAGAFFLDEWAAQHPDACEEEYWELRLRLAGGFADASAGAQARGELLQRLAVAREDPEDQLRAWRRSAALLEEEGRVREAAALFEQAAMHPAAGSRASTWWERASWLWEQAGDRAAATRAIEQALAGVDLEVRERAALDRLRAFNLGVIASSDDAQTVLRFEADPEVRLRAADYLANARFEDDVVTFTRALSDPDPRVLQLCLRQLAARAEAGEFAYVTAHALAFVSHADVEVRLAALELIATTGGRAQVPALLSALQADDRAGFRAARRALEAVTGHVEPAPLDPDLEDRRRLREAWLAWWKSQAST